MRYFTVRAYFEGYLMHEDMVEGEDVNLLARHYMEQGFDVEVVE